jgi:hypothetical protein
MNQTKLIPFCYACDRIEVADGWKIVEKDAKSENYYETLCRECLVSLSDSLIAEVKSNPTNKVA